MLTQTAQNPTALVGSIQKFSIEDGPGIRTTVFLKGCPLSCKWCHNPELISPNQQLMSVPGNCIGCDWCLEHCPNKALAPRIQGGIEIDRSACETCLACVEGCYARALRAVAVPMTVDEVMAVVEQDRGFYDNTGGGMTISGGELLMQPAFARALIEAASSAGINVCLDTSGYGNAGDLMDLALKPNVTDVLFDMKAVDDEVHRTITGKSNELILANLRLLAADPRTAAKLTMRMPLAAGVNDRASDIDAAAALFEELGVKRVTLLPYHDLGASKRRNVGDGEQEEFLAPTDERLEAIKEQFEGINLEVEILGKI